MVGGTAWFQINGGGVDDIALVLAGYALLMAMVQVRLLPLFRTVPFGPAWWAFSFSYAATATYGIRWLEAGSSAHQQVWIDAALIVTTALIIALTARTAVAIARGRFFPPPPAAIPSAPARSDTSTRDAGRSHPPQHSRRPVG